MWAQSAAKSSGAATVPRDKTCHLTGTGGVNLRRIFADEVDGAQSGADRTRAETEFGLGCGVSQDLTLRASARADVIGDDGFTAGLSLNYKFGRNR